MGRFWSWKCLNGNLKLLDKIGWFTSGTTFLLVVKSGNKLIWLFLYYLEIFKSKYANKKVPIESVNSTRDRLLVSIVNWNERQK